MPASDSRTFGAGSLCVFAKVSLANQGDAIAVGSRGWQSVCAVRPGCPAATAARDVGLSLCGLVAVGDFALLG